jgi:hypothetical protein
MGRYFFFCSSVPSSTSALQPMDWCAPIITPVEAQCIEMRSNTRQ